MCKAQKYKHTQKTQTQLHTIIIICYLLANCLSRARTPGVTLITILVKKRDNVLCIMQNVQVCKYAKMMNGLLKLKCSCNTILT